MTCKCGSARIASIYGKTADSFSVRQGAIRGGGYPPTNRGISEDGDSVSFKYCLECGQIQGKFPVPDFEPET